MKKEKIKLNQIEVISFLTDVDKSVIHGGTWNTILLSAKYKCFPQPLPAPLPEPIAPLPETPGRGTSDTVCNCQSNPYGCNEY